MPVASLDVIVLSDDDRQALRRLVRAGSRPSGWWSARGSCYWPPTAPNAVIAHRLGLTVDTVEAVSSRHPAAQLRHTQGQANLCVSRS